MSRTMAFVGGMLAPASHFPRVAGSTPISSANFFRLNPNRRRAAKIVAPSVLPFDSGSQPRYAITRGKSDRAGNTPFVSQPMYVQTL